MNKSDFRGFKQVFLFEFVTGVKRPGFLIFLAILCVMSFVTTPVLTLLGNKKGDEGNKDGEVEKSAIESVYIYDETGLAIDYDFFKSMERYSRVNLIADKSVNYDDAVNGLQEIYTGKRIVVKSEYDSKEGFEITILHSKKTGVSDKELNRFESDFKEFYREEILKNLGVSEDTYENLSRNINVTVMKMDKNGSFSEDEGGISMDDYFLMIAGLMIVFLFINMSVGNVATSIATEKSSRVIEFLLTGTRPMALLSGKISARLLESFITFFAVYSCFFLSQIVSVFLTKDVGAVEGVSDNIVVVSGIWETLTLPRIAVALLYFMSGLVLYTLIGAVTGASVSKLDELQEAYRYYSFLLIICVYFDMFLIIMMLASGENAALQNFCAIFPLTGAFITPALVLTGKISILTGVIALIVIIIAVVVTFVFVSAVYESMLLFQGKRLRGKDVIAIMKKQVVA